MSERLIPDEDCLPKCFEDGEPIESQLVETQIRVRELEGELRILRESEIHRKELIAESAAKDAELEAANARIAELESYKFNADHAANLGILEYQALSAKLTAVEGIMASGEKDHCVMLVRIDRVVNGK